MWQLHYIPAVIGEEKTRITHCVPNPSWQTVLIRTGPCVQHPQTQPWGHNNSTVAALWQKLSKHPYFYRKTRLLLSHFILMKNSWLTLSLTNWIDRKKWRLKGKLTSEGLKTEHAGLPRNTKWKFLVQIFVTPLVWPSGEDSVCKHSSFYLHFPPWSAFVCSTTFTSPLLVITHLPFLIAPCLYQ